MVMSSQRVVVGLLLMFGLQEVKSFIIAPDRQDFDGFAVCITPKIGCSMMLEFTRWSHLDDDVICEHYSNSHIVKHLRDARCNKHTLCSERPSDTKVKCRSRYALVDHGPKLHEINSYDVNRQTSLSTVLQERNETVTHVMVMARDPWVRLLSGFNNKCVGFCALADYACQESNCRNFIYNYPVARVSTSAPPFVRFLRALLDSNPLLLNDHFRRQSDRCLSKKMFGAKYDLVTAIDLDDPLDLALASKYITGDPSTLNATMNPQGHHSVSFCWEGCGEYLDLLNGMKHFFNEDITRLTQLGHPFAGFRHAINECTLYNRTCQKD
eukprot:m.260885 g.260885  ORF g.260885 m.260885 type:complete len:325 (+) comp40823_c0_seq1:95-1069(+)